MATTSAEVAAQTAGAQASNSAQAQRAQSLETVLRPLVDIFEDADGITVYADVPGVSKENLNVHVDGNTLLLEGEAVAAEGPTTRYRRSFALSRELQTDQIEAKVKDGVLSVRIPKRAADRPRKIAIQ